MNSSSKKEILITGASGLLGHELLRLLPPDKYDICAMVRREVKDAVEGVRYLKLDFSDAWSENSLPPSPDIIIHLAQSAHFRDFPEQALDIFRVNVETTARLLDFARAREVGCFVFASSGGIYGSGKQAFAENSPITPIEHLGYYLGSKICGETLAQSYSGILDVKILRPFFMYGARQHRDMLIPRLVDKIRAGDTITLQGKDGIRINPVHVSDAARALIAMLETSGSMTMNIGGSEVLSLREIAAGIGDQLGIKPVFENDQNRANDLIADISIMHRLIEKPFVEFTHGIQEML